MHIKGFRKSFFTILVFILFLSGLKGQCDFRIDSVAGIVTLDSCWVYHPGDDTLWADPLFDDTGWDTISTRMNLMKIGEGVFDSIAWFRLHLVIDNSLRNRTFALNINQQGASEVYLNGSLVKRFGVFSITKAGEDVTDPKVIPGLITFGDSVRYVLAVRYSNHEAQKNFHRFRETDAGFELSVREHDLAMEAMYGQLSASYLVLILLMVFLVLSLVHLLLFLFYRKQRSNLYYSIFMFLFSGLIFVTFLSNNVSENPWLSNRAGYIMSLVFPLFFIPLTGFLYNLFMKKTPPIFWVTIGMAVVLSVIYYFNASFIGVMYIGFVFLLWIEVTRVVILAMVRKYDGAWIIGIGVLFFILFFTMIMLYVIRYGNLQMSGQSLLSLLFGLAVLAAILSIPVSMSVFLARDFARTNRNLELQLEQVKILSAKTLEQEREKKKILEGQKEKLEVLVKERTKELAAEKEKTEELLLNTLPLKVVNELKENGRSEPESFDDVTVYFSDIVGFTSISATLEPGVLIHELNELFTGFDDIMEKHSCERIKTIGDAYLAVSGMPERNPQHAENMARAAMEIRQFVGERNGNSDIQWKIRIGIHSGRVVGGIVGVKKYIYDVFGDTINTTSRMESNSEPMRINVSGTTYELLKDNFRFTPREPMEIKGKGTMQMYFLD